MKDWDKFNVALIMLVIIIIISFVINSANEGQWNNGYCSCGGRWRYQEAVGHSYSTTYIYKCDECGKMKEFSSPHEEASK